jgi:PAS domain S-box-containing protein
MEAVTDKGTQTLLDKRLLKVLLVDDEATDRIPVERILRTCSSPVEFVVESAVNLSEAIKNLTEKQYDVVLLDLELPDSSGIEILQQVIKVAPDIPVVVLTERDDEQTGFSALEDGATDYLVKDLPLDVVLVRTIIYAMQRKKIQMQSLKLTQDINERMKELNCLYGISKLVEAPGISLEEILEKTVCLIPAGWQYPGIACARIVFEGKEYKTDNFKPSKWTQSADIKLQGQKVGTVEVCYMEERPQSDEGPFLGDERDLIDAIGERLGHITERKRAEALVKASEEKYRSLVQNIPDVVWTTDQNGRTAFISSNVKKIYGYTPEEIIEGGDEVWFGRIHPDDIERVKKTYTALFEKEDLFDIEYRTKRKDGEWIWLHDRAMAVYEKNGLKYADGIFKDITERKQAEKALRESEERYKNLFKANIDGILIADATTKKFRYANPAICRMLGYSEEEFMQMGVADIHPKESLEQVIAEFEAQASGAKITADLQCVRKDGQVISVSINANTVMIGQNEYLMGIFRDITERKNKEKLILDANRRLEKVSEELSAAKRDLEQKNEALQKVCSELQQRVKEQTAELAAANRSLGDKG